MLTVLSENATLSKQGWTSKDAYDLSTSGLHQAEANVAADDAAVRTAQLNLSYTNIRAPFAGRIGRTQVHEGAMVTAANTVLNTLVELDPLNVTFNPSETELPAILARKAKGDVAAEVRIGDAGPAFKGKLTFLDNSVDRATGTLVARATIDNPDKNSCRASSCA
jgi:multidrug efflux system membrane fusion protein